MRYYFNGIKDSMSRTVENRCRPAGRRQRVGCLHGSLSLQAPEHGEEKVIGLIKPVYADGAPEVVGYRAVDQMLKPFLSESGLTGRMVRS